MKYQNLKRYFAALGIVAAGFSANAQTTKKFIDPANMDLSVKPGDDFYTYASGTWVKKQSCSGKRNTLGFIQRTS